MARPVQLKRRFTASSLDDVAPLFPLSSHPPLFHRRTHTGVEEPRRNRMAWPRPQTAAPLEGGRSYFHLGESHETVLAGEKLRDRMAREDVAALIDFLKNHPPPPDNFMSKPFEAGDENRGRWSKIKTLTRSKSAPRIPKHIRLPDSAVAGVTIGGHRHIAISIPLEATPYGDKTRSQYPTQSHGMQIGIPSKDCIRTYKNEKGLVTVLRPVTEVFETDSASNLSKSQLYPNANSQGQKPPPLPPHKPTGSVSSPLHDYIGVLPVRFGTPLHEDSSAPWHVPRVPSRGEGSAQDDQHSTVFRRSEYPPRGSSIAARRFAKEPSSIDGVISPLDQAAQRPLVSRGRYFSDPLNANGRKPSEMSGDDPDAREEDHQRATSWSQTLTNNERPSFKRDDNGSQLRTTTFIAESPLLSQDEDLCPPTPDSVRSRRDMVREKKRRDMEAMWKARVREEHTRKAGGTVNNTRQDEAPKTEQPSASITVEGPVLTMSNLVVVMNTRPESVHEDALLQQSRSTSPDDANKDGSRTPASLITMNESSMPTPPTSPHGSPPQKHSATDRTSLLRRREWKVIREQERKAREAISMAKAKAQRLAPGGVIVDEGTMSQSDQDALRLYEAYREHRLRDMERRVRRLEKNGDVWLQALVPVLQNMDRKLTGPDGTCMIEENTSWALKGETIKAEKRESHSIKGTGITGASSISQHILLDKLIGRPGSEDTSSDSMTRSGDASGLDTIEPLMRELAGSSRCRPIMTKAPVVTSGRFHAI